MQAATEIIIRRPSFDYADISPYYFDNNPMLSYLFTSLSLLFPHGERMFIESVRAVRDQVHDEKLQVRIQQFIGQEAAHSQIHHAFNQFAKNSLSVNTDYFTDRQLKSIHYFTKLFGKKGMLALTCAVEHMTALLGTFLLENPEFVDGLDERIKPMWFWHALEEIEHKSVAFDVYRHLYDDNLTRRIMMVLVTFGFSLDTFSAMVYFVGTDSHARNKLPKHLFAFKQLNLVFRGVRADYLDYFRKSFHPDQKNQHQLLEKWRGYIAQTLTV